MTCIPKSVSSAPRAGRSVEGAVAPLREHVLRAAALASRGELPPSPWLAEASDGDQIPFEDERTRTGWAMVSITLIDMLRVGGAPNAKRAFDWFGVPLVDFDGGDAVAAALAPLEGEAGLAPLLPYLLDIYGRTSRLDVMRDLELGSRRAARKKSGSFYTPSDVADFMVGSLASEPESNDFTREWWLDPAVGSGVFLVAALRRWMSFGNAAFPFAATRLFGSDIAPQACDFAAFSLLGQVAHQPSKPVQAWQSMRRNLIAMDATKASGRELRATFGSVPGPLRLICNPPYAAAKHATSLADGTRTRSMYLPFVEMAWTVANERDDAAALVTPLALGTNRSADHRRCRSALSAAGGEATLLFFDRQPHALFGEDAKTRATILVRKAGEPDGIRTSRLLKWTSKQRATIFDQERAVHIGRARIGRLVPKLGSSDEVRLYDILDRLRTPIAIRPEPVTAKASEIVGSALSSHVFVSGTAYNFLNVFRNYPDQISWRGELSASGIHRLACVDHKQADIVTAIMASRMAFWLWHVECDGFHVPAWFLAELPLLNLRFPPETLHELSLLGRNVWEGLQKDILTSRNKDRLTFAFRPTHVAELRDQVDLLLIDVLGLPTSIATSLAEFEQKVVSIDGTVRLRKAQNVQGDNVDAT